MIVITFPDRATERRALAFLLGRFSGRVLASGLHLVSEPALEALARENIAFTVKGQASYEQQVAAIRGAAPAPETGTVGIVDGELPRHDRVAAADRAAGK